MPCEKSYNNLITANNEVALDILPKSILRNSSNIQRVRNIQHGSCLKLSEINHKQKTKKIWTQLPNKSGRVYKGESWNYKKKMTQCTCLEASLWNYEHEKDTFDKNHTDPLKMKRYKAVTTIQSKLSSVDCQVVGHFLFEEVLLRSEAMRILIKQILTAPFSTKRFQIICWLEPASSI